MITDHRLFEIISDQQEHWQRPLGISRLAFQSMEVSYKKVNIITGVRRAGKSTFLRQMGHQLAKDIENKIIPNFLYLHFFDERLGDLTDFDQILSVYFQHNDNPQKIKGRIPLFFDEITLIPQWEKFISRLVESEKYLIFLTGSNSKLLGQEISTELRGRGLSRELFPFNFKEYLMANGVDDHSRTLKNRVKIKKNFLDFLKWGSFPEIVLEPSITLRTEILNEYLDVLLFRDIIERHELAKPSVCRFLLHLLLKQFSCPSTFSRVENVMRSHKYTVDRSFISDFFGFAQEAFILFSVPLFTESLHKQATNYRKIYTIDNGINHVLSGAFFETRSRRLENAIFIHLKSKYKNIYYYKTKSGFEVDFYIPDKELLIQVCDTFSDTNTRHRETRALLEAQSETKAKESLILTIEGSEEDISNPHIQVLNAMNWLLG